MASTLVNLGLEVKVLRRVKARPAPMRDHGKLASGTDNDASEPMRVDAPVETPNQAKDRHAR